MAPENDAPSKGRIAVSLLLFMLGFVITAAAIHPWLRDPIRLHADLRSEKLELLDGWKGGVYSAAFGSSHVNDGFDPRAFDDELSSMQRRTPSINLGIEGGSQTEQRALALEFLRHFSTSSLPDQRPCVLLLELNAGTNFRGDYLVHPRSINIYDWSTVQFALTMSDRSLGARRLLGRDIYAFAAMAMHYANVGMLSSFILKPPINQQIMQEETENDRRGLHALQGVENDFAPVSNAAEAPRSPVPVDQKLVPGNYRLIDELAAASNDPNLHFAYVVAPFYTDLNSYPRFPDSIQTAHGVEPILSLDRPDIYPELFTPKYWHDAAHLNEQGAALASRLLADQLRAWYQDHHRNLNCGG